MVPVVVVDADASSSHGVPANSLQQQDPSINNSTSPDSGSGSVQADAGPRSPAFTEDSPPKEPNASHIGDAYNNDNPTDDDSKASNHHDEEDDTDNDDDDDDDNNQESAADSNSQPEEDDGSKASDQSSSQSNPEIEGLSEYER